MKQSSLGMRARGNFGANFIEVVGSSTVDYGLGFYYSKKNKIVSFEPEISLFKKSIQSGDDSGGHSAPIRSIGIFSYLPLKYKFNDLNAFKIGVITGYYTNKDERNRSRIQLGLQGEYLISSKHIDFGLNGGFAYYSTFHLVIGLSCGYKIPLPTRSA